MTHCVRPSVETNACVLAAHAIVPSGSACALMRKQSKHVVLVTLTKSKLILSWFRYQVD